MSTALVTGATGMLGSYVVERLLGEAWTVRALARAPGRARWLRERGAEVVAGDLLDPASLEAAAHRADLIVHAAAAIGSGGDYQGFYLGNVVGTRNVLNVAAAVGARLVHVSSTAVFGESRYRESPTDEAAPLPRLPETDAYGRTKQEAELVVLDGHDSGRVWATIVRPPVMYGRRDRQFIPRVGPVLLRGWFPLIRGGRSLLTLVHAASVADGVFRAGTDERAGGRIYHLTNDFPVRVSDFVRLASEGLGRRVRSPDLPLLAGRAAFAGLGVALRAAGRSDLARHAPGTLRMLTRDNPFSSARARAELAWAPPVPPASGLPDAFRWWLRQRREPSTSRV